MKNIFLKTFVISFALACLTSCGSNNASDNQPVDPYAGQYPGQFPGQYPGQYPDPCGGCNLPPDPCGGCYLPPSPPLPPITPPCGGCYLPPEPPPCGDCYLPPEPPPPPSFDSGFQLEWSSFQQCVQHSVTIPIPRAGAYYLSFKGNYSGDYENVERLKIKLGNGNWHNIKDLDQQEHSGERTKSCKVPVTYQINTAGSYTVYLLGNEHSVTQAQVRLTSYYPSNLPDCE
jgi:hypothetical protein